MNTSIDQSLELEKVVTQAETPKKFNSRIVQKYDLSTVSASLVDGTIGLGFKAYLNLHTLKSMEYHMTMRFTHIHYHNLFQMVLEENYKILKILVE